MCANRSSPQGQLYRLDVKNRYPALSNQTLLRDIQIEQVEGMIYGLYFADFYKPVLDMFGSGNKNPVSVVLRLSQHL